MLQMSPAVSNLQNDAYASLNRLKQDQRAVANYAVLMYAGVVACSRFESMEPNTLLLEFVLFCIFSLAAGMVWRMQSGMTGYRKKLQVIYSEYFTEEEQNRLSLTLSIKAQFYDPIFVGIIAVTLLGGMFLSMLLI